ncbi:acetyl-CoA:L-glutamate N-acetyltransferase KNAG_0B05260 [Huiozyma naganishii CBS 8797]|uniref:Amino-acid acetyltransferase, mitochondrial n=1 Tax=Huiozyma naganishii (strain ATCC MYA-139 / BCRC 22969 / CBS 8797 / KCTC 17520 / NBRC 10181 / NCYC 3082 / Yp74L-3) TaxID=1071383 RepID=J7S3Y5_HUIN7|nr:hypothetical protein KNAG_0B05260 [Kazachstania naganishii CBS 8797]CCK68959.1 hypothetical protein KNAG_0B05260 [Kazachstania naganishii CBS 8797]
MWRHIFNNTGSQVSGRHTSSSRNLILSILNSTATKREARDYLTKYTNEPETINHCLLVIRHLHFYRPQILQQLSNTIKRLRILGLRPICVIPPSKHLMKQGEILDKIITQARLKPLHIQDGLVKTTEGTYKSVLQDSNSNVFDNSVPDFVPIIKPYIYDERKASEYIANDMIKFMTHMTADPILKIDKLFILNRIGGIPSGERNDNAHVFINLSQEFASLSQMLKSKIASLAKREPQSENLLDRMLVHIQEDQLVNMEVEFKEHLQDLQLANSVLSNLPFTSTGLITTVNSAALTSDKNNPLLYNLLTDRSLISSSLPRFKRRAPRRGFESLLAPEEMDTFTNEEFDENHNDEKNNYSSDAVFVTTVLKKGVDIRIFDDKLLTAQNSIGLIGDQTGHTDANSEKKILPKEKINLTKMKAILDQSFNRSLNLEHYMKRINGRIAAIIVIGDYEGIAILTYEGPKDNQFVYLDKFAVLPHLKGSLGISDIIFNLMFKKFPEEVVWRSRKNNIVNKWYFQRSVTVVDLSVSIENDQKDSQFKLFYYGNPESTEKTMTNVNRLKEYVRYVRDIKPSWDK